MKHFHQDELLPLEQQLSFLTDHLTSVFSYPLLYQFHQALLYDFSFDYELLML